MRPPIEEVLPELLAALADGPAAVLEAPPGAGKTTRVPLALMDAPWAAAGRIVMLEPRRVAARAAAARLAEQLGEGVGGRIGYRIRHEARVGRETRVEVVTEGILTRRLQSDPELAGVSCLIFDEFHERSIHADLGLALALEAQSALRPDLKLLVMSATLDGAAVAALIARATGETAPIIRSEGRMHDVQTRWLAAPAPPRGLEERLADEALALMDEAEGDALAFLPGAAEIRRAEARAKAAGRAGLVVAPLYGDLPFAAQQAALAPAPGGARKLVLATAIAETSLTIEGVRLVIDAGRARRARFDPGAGMSRLLTGRVSRAAADQRRGRAGRTAPGLCLRLWTEGEHGGLAPFDPPEILEADLASLALDLALWGADPAELAFLDPPPEAALEQARALLRRLGALDAAGRATDHGRAMAAAPLHPRLAHMALSAGGARSARRLAALLEERDPLRGAGADLALRLAALERPRAHAAAEPALRRIADAAEKLGQRLPKATPPAEPFSLGGLVALAFPDRVAVRRPGVARDAQRGAVARHLLSGGKGAKLAAEDPLAGEAFLAVAELGFPPASAAAAAAREADIRLAAPIAKAELEALFAGEIVEERVCAWSKRDRAALARRRRLLGAAPLEDHPWTDADPDMLARALAGGVRQVGLDALPWTKPATRLRARVARARAAAPELPDWSDAALLADLEDWLAPHMLGMSRQSDLAALDLAAILEARLDWAARQNLDRLAPAHYAAPTGAKKPIDYDSDPPKISIRLQELFGVDVHPTIAGTPLLIELLSPAQRPIQTTADLPGFWRGSYADVAKDMRARYPRHPWPDDPAAAAPTTRAKPRKGGS